MRRGSVRPGAPCRNIAFIHLQWWLTRARQGFSWKGRVIIRPRAPVFPGRQAAFSPFFQARKVPGGGPVPIHRFAPVRRAPADKAKGPRPPGGRRGQLLFDASSRAGYDDGGDETAVGTEVRARSRATLSVLGRPSVARLPREKPRRM